MSIKTVSNSVFLCFLSFLFIPLTSSAQGTETMVSQALKEMVAQGELVPSDIDEYRMTDHYVTRNSNLDHMYFCQTYNGIDIHNAVGAIHVQQNGNVLTKNIDFSKNFRSRMTGSQTPVLDVLEAVRRAAEEKNLNITEDLSIISTDNGPDRLTTISKGGISTRNITAKLKYVDTGKAVRLSWEVTIYEISGENWWNLRMDANNGALLDEDNMVDQCFTDLHDHSNHDHAPGSPSKIKESKNENLSESPFALFVPDSYKVFSYPKSNPYDGGVSVEVNPADASASPFGWHDTNGSPGAEFTTTQGNNVHSYLDLDDNVTPDGPSPDGGMSLDFLFDYGMGDGTPTDDAGGPPSGYREASQTNLFYWNNILHDVSYLYGFDEAAGNFQENNYGNGGSGGDYVFARCQSGANIPLTCNATFGTPPDGFNPSMRMFICDLAPVPGGGPAVRDGSLDNEVIAHEFAHGVSNRLVGGPANVSCLNNDEQMGEGWSDYYSLIFTLQAGDSGTEEKGVGTYLLGQGPGGSGIRVPPFNGGLPYSTDFSVNNHTYGELVTGSLSRPHGLGYLWAMMLWEMTWELIDIHGLNPDIYGDWTTGGNNLALKLVIDGLALTPCSPGFVDGRDAILMADLNLTGGANQCAIWRAFARRGLGFSADQGSTASSFDGTEAFDLPPFCIIAADPEILEICSLDDAVYTITAPIGMNNWTLSTTGEPAGTSVAFSLNPVAPGGMTTMTISGPGSAVPGMYNINISGSDGIQTIMNTIDLFISDVQPTPQHLISPIDMTNGIFNPTFVWDDSNGATSWLLQVDDDPGFGSPEVNETLMTNTYSFAGSIFGTTYYWKVTGNNGCGIEESPVWSFTTAVESCTAWVSTDVPQVISSSSSSLVMSTIDILEEGFVTDMDVTNLAIMHTWVGDLEITLRSPAGTEVDLIFDVCDSQQFINMDINFDDESGNAYGDIPCPPTDGMTYQPLQALSAFDGECITGTWTLLVRDDFPFEDGGQLNSWSLSGCYLAPQTCYADVDMDGYGDPATEITQCGPCLTGFVLNSLDCDDDNAEVTAIGNLCDDMDTTTGGDFINENCECVGGFGIPTLSQWSIIALGMIMLILGLVGLKQRKVIFG